MPVEIVVLILTGAAAALAHRQLNGPRKNRPEPAPVRVRVERSVARRR